MKKKHKVDSYIGRIKLGIIRCFKGKDKREVESNTGKNKRKFSKEDV